MRNKNTLTEFFTVVGAINLCVHDMHLNVLDS